MGIIRETLRSKYSKVVLTGLVAAILVVLFFSCFCSNSQAQTNTTFTSSDKFSVPELNGTISFSVNGSYSSATFENQTWSFTNLRLRNSLSFRTLKVSVENSNITIFPPRTNNTFFRSSTLRYLVEGQGKQTVNLGLNTSRRTDASEWTVTIPGPDGNTVFLAEGEGWTLLPDNSVVVTGITGNLSVTHFSSFIFENDPNSPFYQQHSVSIITAASVAATVAIAVVIKFKVRR